MKPTKKHALAALAVVAILALAFWYGGNAPGAQGAVVPSPVGTTPVVSGEITPIPAPSASAPPTELPAQSHAPTPSEPPLPRETPALTSAPTPTVVPAAPTHEVTGSATAENNYLTGPVPEGKPLPMEPQDATISDTAYTCTLSVRCDTILSHMDWLDPEKAELVPEDGVIFPATAVTFYEGESVFNVLQRELKKSKIHMEFVNTPLYNSAYIEGIHNLYEFDCGELSGWMYRVNDWFPNYGCSRYGLKDGDVVEWVYTCDLGADVST